MQGVVDTSGPIRGEHGRARPWDPQYGNEACVRDSAESLENVHIGQRVQLAGVPRLHDFKCFTRVKRTWFAHFISANFQMFILLINSKINVIRSIQIIRKKQLVGEKKARLYRLYKGYKNI